MPPSDAQINETIGRRIGAIRRDHDLSLPNLASEVGISESHLRNLESGRHSFSAALLTRLARALMVPPGSLLDPEPAPDARFDALRQYWEEVFSLLRQGDRARVLDLAQGLLGARDPSLTRSWMRAAIRDGLLVSVEGIDGVWVESVGRRLARRLRRNGADDPWCGYTSSGELWPLLQSRIRDTMGPNPAFERTLLFGVERFLRQEQLIRQRLFRGDEVVSPFFYLAPRVYQQTEKLTDLSLVEELGHFMLPPDLVVVIRSDAADAARRAVPREPGPGQFFSPYFREEDFRTAQSLYLLEAAKEGGGRPPTLVVDSADPDIDEALWRFVEEARRRKKTDEVTTGR